VSIAIGRAADDVGGGAGSDRHADVVGDRGFTGEVGADEIPFDLIARRVHAGNLHAVARVAGDQVAETGGWAADDVVGRAALNQDAGLIVQCRASRTVR